MMKKKILLTLVMGICAVLFCCVSAMAASSGTYGELNWTLNDEGLLTISGTGMMGSSIDDGCGPWGTGIESVIIYPGATNIGECAFDGCSGLMSITIPDSVTYIEDLAFNGCSSLTEITIPYSVTSIGEGAFQCCSSLMSIMLSDGLVNMDGAFIQCTSLTSITIPDGVVSMDYAFIGCSSLRSIEIPDSVVSMDRAFENCRSLTSIIIPEGVTSIGTRTFALCENLASITIPASVTQIENQAFYVCKSLTSITIPENVTSIGDEAFYLCGSLMSITIPDSVTSIGDSAFSGCRSLMSITIPEGVTSIENYTFQGCSSLTNITIPEGVTSIGGGAFSGCANLTDLTIPETVTSIGDDAFSLCRSLMSITILEGVTNIGDEAFYFCDSLMSITIPDSVTSIGEGAFSNCWSLTSITIPDGVASIGNFAFDGCRCLKKIKIPDSVVTFGDDIFGDNASVTVYCNQLSEADYWADSLGLSIVYTDIIPASEIRTLEIENNYNLPIGVTKKIVYNVFPMDDFPSVTLVSSNPQIASIDKGYITGISKGSCVITAECDSVSASVTVTVYQASTGFELPSDEEWFLAGDDLVLSVVDLTPADAEPDLDLTWTSSDAGKASVDDSGVVHTLSTRTGIVTISVTNTRGLTRTCLLHICYPVTEIAFEPVHETIVPDQDVQLTANVTMRTQSCVNHLVTFTSSNEEIATVDELTGMLHPVAEGMVTVTATSKSGKTASIDILVDHDWGEPEYVWDGGNLKVTATRVCAFDGEHVETETVGTTAAIQSPTATKEGNAHYTVTFANEAFADQEKNVFILALNSMTVLHLPVTLTTIEMEAFDNVAAEAIILPDTVTAIEPKAFTNCMNLQYIRIPAGVTVPDDAFEGSQNVVVDQ